MKNPLLNVNQISNFVLVIMVSLYLLENFAPRVLGSVYSGLGWNIGSSLIENLEVEDVEKAKEEIEEKVKEITEKADETTKKVDDAVEQVKEVAKEAVDKIKDTATAVEVAATIKGDTQVAELAKKTKNEIEKTEQIVNEVVEVAKDKISVQKKIIKEKDEILKNELLTQAQKFCEYVKMKNIVKQEVDKENENEENEDVEKAKEQVSNILGGLDTSVGNYANFDFSK
jgi:hypothetical protein